MSGNTSEIYDALAPFYREYSEKRSAYLKAVDTYVMDHIPERASSLLDVGAGDGIRGMSIANSKGIKDITLCEPSREMIALCKKFKTAALWQFAAENLPETEKKLDIIICLWNVLGHLNGRHARIQALKGMKRLLSDNGIIFIDVNNRHNAVSYGWLRVMGRIIADAIHHDEIKGDASFNWEINGKIFPAMGHLFTPHEMHKIIEESGLKIINRVTIDYNNGAISLSSLKGQLLYSLMRDHSGGKS
jgi:ubiquinone/menaquinone biosynthesis C-methylase UbiE